MFKVIRSNIQITITPPRIVRFRRNLVRSIITSQTIHYKCSRSNVKGQRWRSQRNITYQQWKRYKTATDMLSDFKLGMGVVIKAVGTDAASGGLKLQCIRNCYVSLVFFKFLQRIIVQMYEAWSQKKCAIPPYFHDHAPLDYHKHFSDRDFQLMMSSISMRLKTVEGRVRTNLVYRHWRPPRSLRTVLYKDGEMHACSSIYLSIIQ